MTEFASILIAKYRHREHSRDGRLHGHCPVLVGPRTYTHSPQRWRVMATVVHTAQQADGTREADVIDMTLTMGGRDVLSYVEAYMTAQEVVQKHIDELGSSYDQYFDLFVLIPKSVARAKALAKAKRRAKK